MPFRAFVDGEDVVSLHIEREAWRAFAARAKAGEDVVRMVCCRAEGIFKISPRGRQFFAHKGQPKECLWKSESPEHLELKATVHDAIRSVDGWQAAIEASGADWRADVLATRGRAQIAFEVQLSAQGQAITWLRENRYESASVLPWWIVSSRNNAGQGFGSGLRSVVRGGDFAELARSTVKAVRDVLRRVESQVRLAEAIMIHLRERKIEYRLHKFCGLPIVFVIDRGKLDEPGEQAIVIGELGADAVPDLENLRRTAPESPWGSVAQFVRYAPQIKGFGAPAFFLKRDPVIAIPPVLDKLIAGDLVWRGRQHTDQVEAALVWYRETCRECGRPFARSPFAISGHLRRWANYEPRLIPFHLDETKPWTQEVVRRFEQREQLRLGTRWYAPSNNAESAAVQNCPHCGHSHVRSLISAEQALSSWPYGVVDWTFRVPVKDGKWARPSQPPNRQPPSVRVWLQILENARRQRDKAEREERERQREDERKMAEWRNEMRRRREREAAAAEAARAEAARQWKEQEERRLAEEAARREAERKIRADDARTRLFSLAVSKFGREDQAELWMHGHQPRIGGRPLDICVGNFEACVNLLPKRRRR